MRFLSVSMVVCALGCATVPVDKWADTPVLHQVPAGTEVREYDIHGETEAELRAEMNRVGPTDDKGGARHDAYTRWFVKWNYPFDQTSAGCATGPVTITLTVTMDLPRWVEAESGANALKARWQEYLDALVNHETGHRDHAVQAASEIERALPLLPAQADCTVMEKVANDAGFALLEKYRQADIAYDDKTSHGATQGARFH